MWPYMCANNCDLYLPEAKWSDARRANHNPASETENQENGENGENVRIIATITLSAKHVRYYIDNEKYDKNKSQINEERMAHNRILK